MLCAHLAIWSEEPYRHHRTHPPILFCILSDPRCHPVDPIYRVCPGSTALARHLWTPCRGICRWLAADSSLAFRSPCVSCTLPYSPARIHMYVRARICASLMRTTVVKHFDFIWLVPEFSVSSPCALFSRMIFTRSGRWKWRKTLMH